MSCCDMGASVTMTTCHPTSLRSFGSDRPHALSHASCLRDSNLIDDGVAPSHQVGLSAGLRVCVCV